MFIRTKDGRIIDTTKVITGSKYMDFATNDESFRAIFKTEPLAKSDTIEELCDYLMFVDNDEKEDILITDVNEINITYSKNETCYGCIKIKLPNGAIRIEPVAKFNEKWSFELICL